MLSVLILNAIMLKVIMLNVVMLNVIMLGVMALPIDLKLSKFSGVCEIKHFKSVINFLL
jgi:hypothetical protein